MQDCMPFPIEQESDNRHILRSQVQSQLRQILEWNEIKNVYDFFSIQRSLLNEMSATFLA